MRRLIAFGLVLGLLGGVLSGCAGVTSSVSLDPVSFDDLPGWAQDHQSEILVAFNRSCNVLAKKSPSANLGISGTAGDWRRACSVLASVPARDDQAARYYFEHYFRPYAVSGENGSDGLFTGYYEAELRGSLHKSKKYPVPLYEKPKDLISADLGKFKTELKGQKIVGKVKKNEFVPYDDRAEIVRTGLKGRAKMLVWVADPIDAFFLEIQGSGRVKLDSGKVLRIGYDGANGRAYVAIGRVLGDAKDIERPVTMAKIRQWLADNPERRQEVMNTNPSYVFFREIKGDGPIGAQNVALTPQRSLAVDPAFIPLGSPLWLDTVDGSGSSLQRLVVAQDTGGAIKGAVRGDMFWGAGAEAEEMAGPMQSRGRYFILLPTSDER